MRACFMAALALTAGCGQLEAARWRGVREVYVVMDTTAFFSNLNSALESEGIGNVTVKNAPPVYKLRDGGVMVYFHEGAIPPQTSFVPMTAHQAVAAALGQEGAQGICVKPRGEACTRRLSREQAEALEAELKKDGLKPKPFAMKIAM